MFIFFCILIPLLLISLISVRVCVVSTAYISILFNVPLSNFFLHKALVETSWKTMNFPLCNPMSAQVFYLQIASSIHPLGRHTLLMDAELWIFLFNLVRFSNYFYAPQHWASWKIALFASVLFSDSLSPSKEESAMLTSIPGINSVTGFDFK